jgi:uncharacterized protein
MSVPISANAPAFGASAPGVIPRDVTGGPVTAASERIHVLDILRGVALFGMFLVHFSEFSQSPKTSFGHSIELATNWFFANRFMTMFAILFGVGFAVQLSRAETRGDRFGLRYVRRLVALAVFGIIAEDLFGLPVLLEYAIWGLPLLLVRSWSNRSLLVALFLCLLSTPIYWLGRAAYDEVSGGTDKVQTDGGLCAGYGLPFVSLPSFDRSQLCQAERKRRNEYQRDIHPQRSAGYLTLVRQRFTATWAKFSHPWPMTFLPTNVFSLFLIGLLGFQLGVFQQPREHRRLLWGVMILGLASEVISTWFLYQFLFSPAAAAGPLALQLGVGFVVMPLIRDVWLAFVYLGAILLLVSYNPAWIQRLRAFGITGRMALTNYVLQVMILDLLFSHYGFEAALPVEYAPLAAVALFGLDVALSSWWQSRYRYGPLEWLWRSVTYWRIQPMRLQPATSSA